MKVLYLTDPEADYGAELLYFGLVRLLGVDQVVDYPRKPCWHTIEPTYTYTPGSVPHYPQHEGHTTRLRYFAPVWTRGWDKKEVVEALRRKEFDLMVLSSTRRGVQYAAAYLKSQAPFPEKVIVCDHEDHSDIHASVVIRFGACAYFKRELFHEDVVVQGIPVFPLPFSCALQGHPADPFDPGRKGAFLSCSLTHPMREAVLRVLRGCKDVTVGENAYHGADYDRGLQNALVGISVRGHGVDTLRQWEIPFHGACLLTDSTITVPNDFDYGPQGEAVRYRNLEELQQKLVALLQDPEGTRRRAKRGQEKLLAHHTCEARAQYVLDKVFP